MSDVTFPPPTDWVWPGRPSTRFEYRIERSAADRALVSVNKAAKQDWRVIHVTDCRLDDGTVGLIFVMERGQEVDGGLFARPR